MGRPVGSHKHTGANFAGSRYLDMADYPAELVP
jgi:hypothetical protein